MAPHISFPQTHPAKNSSVSQRSLSNCVLSSSKTEVKPPLSSWLLKMIRDFFLSWKTSCVTLQHGTPFILSKLLYGVPNFWSGTGSETPNMAFIGSCMVKLCFSWQQYPNAELKALHHSTKSCPCPPSPQRYICKLHFRESHRELLTGLQRKCKNVALQTTIAFDLWHVFGKQSI